MFGKNPKLPFDKDTGEILKVHSIFKTFQGEGPYAGYPSVFIRLHGCNLSCKFCDTEFDDFLLMSTDEIVTFVLNFKKQEPFDLIVVTGGEPFRQNLFIICNKLLNSGFKVQIESNGTLYNHIPDGVFIVCSPKILSSDTYQVIRDDILKRCIAIKFLISHNIKRYSRIADVGQINYKIPVYVQPIDEYDDEINKKNVELSLKIAKETGSIISLQLHKILNIE